MRGSSSTKTVDAIQATADVTEIFSAFDSFVLSRTNSSSRESALERHARITRSRYSQNVPKIPVEFSGKYFLLEIRASGFCASSSINLNMKFPDSSTTTSIKSGIQSDDEPIPTATPA